MSDTSDVPLLEVLDSIPLNGRSWWQVSTHEHRNIPYGNICQQSAIRIRQLERELAEAKANYALAHSELGSYVVLLAEMTKFRDLLSNKEVELLKQLTAHKAALNLCQMALNSDNHETYLELKFEALSEIAKLKGVQ